MTNTVAPVPDIDIAPGDWRIVQDILRRHVPNHAVWAFGSRARKNAKPWSWRSSPTSPCPWPPTPRWPMAFRSPICPGRSTW